MTLRMIENADRPMGCVQPCCVRYGIIRGSAMNPDTGHAHVHNPPLLQSLSPHLTTPNISVTGQRSISRPTICTLILILGIVYPRHEGTMVGVRSVSSHGGLRLKWFN